MTVNTPKDPIDGVTEWTNEETGIKYRYVDGAWRAISSKAAQDVADALGQLDLEKVLTNGNVADKSIVLTNGSNDALLLSPEEARIMIGGVGEDVVPSIELRHSQGVLETSVVKLEIDEGGKRFDVECDEKVDNIHFRFNDDIKLELNKEGDAVFTGKVKVQPGEQDNEVVTYSQLTLLEEQIEEIAPSLEHGKWEFTFDYPPQVGQYTMIKEVLDEDAQEQQCAQTLAECQLANENDPVELGNCSRDFDACMDGISGTKFVTTKSWFSSTRIVFSDVDKDGTIHRWNDIKPGEYIEVFNVDGSGGMVSEITKKNYKGDISHMPDKGAGEAHDLAAVKIYNLPDASPADFVHTSGDTMTGTLRIEPTSESTNLYLRGSSENADGKNIIDVYSNTGKEILWVDSTHVGVNNTARTPTSSSHLTSKQYVDGNFLPLTGGTVTNAFRIKPTGDDTPLGIYSGPTASENMYLMWAYGKPFEVDGEERRNIVFYITAGGDVAAHSSWSPTKTNHLATKRYVDSKAASGEPATYSWKFRKTSSLPNDGEMTCSKELPTSGDIIKLSHKTYNGIQMSRRRDTVYFNSSSGQPLITIWDLVPSGYRHKYSASVSKIEQDSEGNFIIKVASSNGAENHNITLGEQQWITIGGFF